MTDHHTAPIISAAIEVHRYLGPGLLERTYRRALSHELELRGHHVEADLPVPLHYKGVVLEAGLRLDLLVDDVVLELRSVPAVLPVHKSQLLTHLRLTGRPLGLLINFRVPLLHQGITRVLNSHSAPR